jgi:hypothetical protein
MTTKVVTFLKYVGLISIVFFTIISCEKEIEGIGVDIIDNNKFSTGKLIVDVNTATENIERVPANGISQYLLGVYNDNELGELKGSIVSQIVLPVTGTYYDYGDNAAIDSVLIFIPYQSTQEDDDANGKPVFKIDSIIGDTEVEFQLGVYELETFLNTLDPSDPSKQMIYYSDKVFEKNPTPFYLKNFKVNPNDTITYIKRYMPDGTTVFDKDTIQQTNSAPVLKLPLNEAMIQQIFIDNASGSEFSSNDAFVHYFRGFYIEATTASTNQSHLISLSMTGAKMVIYYSNNQNEGTDVDLNGNGIKGEQNVRMKESFEFTFGNNKSNVLERAYPTPHQSGTDRLYIQGAAGSLATVDLFAGYSEADLDELRNNNLLITNAQLTFYVDQNASSNIAPEQLFIYNYQDNEQILDMFTEGISAIEGSLERDEDGNPYKYTFKITDYISKLLTTNDPADLVTLGIKVYNPTDSPETFTDVTVLDYSWVCRGVVLYNQSQSAGDKKAQLEISYTKLTNQ